MISHLGKDLLDYHTTQAPAYKDGTLNTAAKKKLKEGAWDQWMAYLMMKGSDYPRYGSLIRGFGAQFSLGNDQYPKDLITATDIMSNHKLDPKYFENREARKKAYNKQQHEKKDSPAETETSFAQTEADCYACGKKGHVVRDCKNKPNKYADWHVNKAMSAMKKSMAQAELPPLSEAGGDEESDSDDESVGSRASNRSTTSRSGRSGTPARGGMRRTRRTQYRSEWSAFQQECEWEWTDETGISHKQTSELLPDLQDLIILDTGSTIEGTFMNPDLVHDIRPSKRPIGMQTNAGTKRLNIAAKVPGFGEVWYDPTNMANIFGFSAMKDKVKRIQYDSNVEDAFIVTHKNDDTAKFPRTKEGLYAYKPTGKYIEQIAYLKGSLPPEGSERHWKSQWPSNRQVSFMSSVKENMMGYTPRQLKDAKAARKLYRAIGSPSLENMKMILKQNLIEDCSVTTKDVETAERVFGPDVGTLKGKTVRKKSPVVKNDLIEIPPEILERYQDLVLEIDLMFVNGMPMLTSIDTTIKFRSLIPLKDQTAEELYKALDVVLRKYNKNKFRVNKINCDQQFKPLMEDVEDNLGIRMNYAPRDEHVPAAERNNRTISERIRVTYHSLPYKAMPKIMLRHLAMISAWQLNLFPVKGGVSSYYSPYVIMGEVRWQNVG